MSSIHEVAMTGNTEILQLLIDNGINLNLKDSKGLRPLHYAAWQGRTEPVYILLRHGAHVNDQSLTGDTPLHFASQYGHEEIVQLLLFHQADPTIFNRRLLTSIDLACEHGHFHVVNQLVHHRLGQQYILNTHYEQQTPLHLAAKNGHTDIVRLLLMNGMDINRLTMHDGSALHVACRNGRYETAKLLLECGIDIHLCDSYEQTAYEVVIKQKTGNDIKRLIKGWTKDDIRSSGRSFSRSRILRCCASSSHSLLHGSSCWRLEFRQRRLYYSKRILEPCSLDLELFQVLERHSTGQWRGFILQEDLTTRTGYFPNAFVQWNTTRKHRSQWTRNNKQRRTARRSSPGISWGWRNAPFCSLPTVVVNSIRLKNSFDGFVR